MKYADAVLRISFPRLSRSFRAAGSDGVLGARAIKESGGLVLVQDPHDAATGDMPRAVVHAGIADVVRPVRESASQFAELSRVVDVIAAPARCALIRYGDARPVLAVRPLS